MQEGRLQRGVNKEELHMLTISPIVSMWTGDEEGPFT